MSEVFNKALRDQLISIAQASTIDPLKLAEQLIVNLQNEFVGAINTHGTNSINFSNLINLDAFLGFVKENRVNVPKNLSIGSDGQPAPMDIGIVIDQEHLNELINNIGKQNPQINLEQVAEKIRSGFVQYGNILVNLKGLGAYIQSLFGEAKLVGGMGGQLLQTRLNAIQNEMVQKGLIEKGKEIDFSGDMPQLKNKNENQKNKQPGGPQAQPGQAQNVSYVSQEQQGEQSSNLANALKESNPAGSPELVQPLPNQGDNRFIIAKIGNFAKQVGQFITNPNIQRSLTPQEFMLDVGQNPTSVLIQPIQALGMAILQWDQIAPPDQKWGIILPSDAEYITTHLNASPNISYQLMALAGQMVDQLIVILETLAESAQLMSVIGPQVDTQLAIAQRLRPKFSQWQQWFRQKGPAQWTR